MTDVCFRVIRQNRGKAGPREESGLVMYVWMLSLFLSLFDDIGIDRFCVGPVSLSVCLSVCLSVFTFSLPVFLCLGVLSMVYVRRE